MTYNAEEFRVQLLLALPEWGLLKVPALEPMGRPSDQFPGADLLDAIEHDVDYDPAALAAWVLDQVSAARVDAVATARAAVEDEVSHVAQISAAAASVSVTMDITKYFGELATTLKGNLGLSQQWELARSIEAQALLLVKHADSLVAAFPEVAEV